MNQLVLLTIPRQPAPKDPAIPSRTIKSFVRDRLRGFPERQAERVRMREAARRKYEGTDNPQTKQEERMRTIKVTYRAIFEQPIGALNPLNAKLPGPQPVEIFGHGNRWKAREIATPHRRIYSRLPEFQNPDSGQMIVGEHFARQVQEWQIWGTPPTAAGEFYRPERQLRPGVDICDLGDSEWGFYTPDDHTHVGEQMQGTSQCKTRCNETVSFKKVVSTRANVEPTCPACAEIYRQEFQRL